MNPSILRQLWSIIEQTQAQTLLSLNHADLIQCLLGKLQQRKQLSHDDLYHLSNYISLRISLIRDVAEARIEEKLA